MCFSLEQVLPGSWGMDRVKAESGVETPHMSDCVGSTRGTLISSPLDFLLHSREEQLMRKCPRYFCLGGFASILPAAVDTLGLLAE